MKVLVITPKLPYPATGADEQDRFFGIKLLKEMGHEVQVIAKIASHQTHLQVVAMSEALGVPVVVVPYTHNTFSFTRVVNPYFIDGAAYEYTDLALRKEVDQTLESFKPDVVWVDGSYAWPIAAYTKKKGVRTILRSLNIESRHLLSDEGWSPVNLMRAFSKELGERSLNKRADIVYAITEAEKKLYKNRGVNAQVLPLRSVPYILEDEPHTPKETETLRVVFSGSTYSVGHNLKAARFLIEEIAPQSLGIPIHFSITGAKLPNNLTHRLPNNVSYEGYVSDYRAFLLDADVVLAPSLGGAGMQQKIFEPIARGIPTITSSRGLGGYDFVPGEEVLLADSKEAVGAALQYLCGRAARQQIGNAGRAKAEKLFAREVFYETIQSTLDL